METARADVYNCYKSGNTVFLSLNNVAFANGYTSGDIELGTVPYTPKNYVRFIGYVVDGDIVFLGVNPQGKLTLSAGLKNYTARQLIYASCSYII